MSLKQYNSLILEWMIASGNEQLALRFWHEIGEPKEVDGAEIELQVETKLAIERNDYAAALNLLSQIPGDTAHEDKAHAQFRIKFATLILMITSNKEAEQVIEYAKQIIVPSIDELEPGLSSEYPYLLDCFISLLVLPESAHPQETKFLCDEAHLRDWVLERVQAYFAHKKGEPRLSKMVNCYRIIEEQMGVKV